MKKAVIGFLKLAVPIALGMWLVVYFYRQLDEVQRAQLFTAFRAADLKWLFASVVIGWPLTRGINSPTCIRFSKRTPTAHNPRSRQSFAEAA